MKAIGGSMPAATPMRAFVPCTAARAQAAAPNGAWSGSACAGTSWTPLPKPRSRPAFRPQRTSTAAATRGWATSRSTKRAACAGTPPRPSCGPPAMAAPISSCGPMPRSASCCSNSCPPAACAAAAPRSGPARKWSTCRQARRCCCARAPSTPRRSCSCRASARARCCRTTALPCATTCPAWARTCRTICRSARSTRSRARAR